MDLWTEWRCRATNLADDNRAETAATSLARFRGEMEPARRADVLASRSSHHRRADDVAPRSARTDFATEYQGIASSPEGAEFPASWFDRSDLWFDQWPRSMKYRVQSLDPSKGSDSKTGDYQAHVMPVGAAKNG